MGLTPCLAKLMGVELTAARPDSDTPMGLDGFKMARSVKVKALSDQDEYLSLCNLS